MQGRERYTTMHPLMGQSISQAVRFASGRYNDVSFYCATACTSRESLSQSSMSRRTHHDVNVLIEKHRSCFC